LDKLFHNPIYAGAYAWGRSHTDPRKKVPGHPWSGRTTLSLENCEVLLKDRLPAYISWEQFELNQQQIKENWVTVKGAVREGRSLLSGLLICGHCRHSMSTKYTDNGSSLRYLCDHLSKEYQRPPCQSIAGPVLDNCIEKLVIKALEPAALEVSQAVASDIGAEQKRLDQHWKQKLERADIESERMFRQYNTVEPENRLVARTLEAQWEAALAAAEQLKQEYERYKSKQPRQLDAQAQAQLLAAAQDIRGLWRADTTPVTARKQIIRLLVDQVVVTVENNTEKVQLEVHWIGGTQITILIERSVARMKQLSTYLALQARVKALYYEEISVSGIVNILNEEDWRTARLEKPFSPGVVRRLLSSMGFTTGEAQKRRAAEVRRESGEWTLGGLSGKVDIPISTLRYWVKNGTLKGRLTWARGRKLQLVVADNKELSRLKGINQTQIRLKEAL
jgi:hypothetical protein